MENFSAAITFGRFNPPTKGHMLLVDNISKLPVDKKMIFMSKSHDNKKNPLSFEDKLAYMRALVNENYSDVEVVDTETKTLYGVLHQVYAMGCNEVYIVLGGDRIEPLRQSITDYNGLVKEGADGPIYKFDKIHFVNAGNRTNGDIGLAGMSATKARNFVRDNNFEGFADCIPTKDRYLIKELFDDVRRGLRIK